MFSNLCIRSEKKIIATKDCSITCRPNILQQLMITPTKTTQGRTSVFDIGGWVGGAVKVNNCTLAYTQGCLRGMCPLRSWKFCIFETEIVHYGDISANLDQAMSKTNKQTNKNGKRCKKKHTHTHTHTQFLRPNWPKFCIWEEFLIIFC